MAVWRSFRPRALRWARRVNDIFPLTVTGCILVLLAIGGFAWLGLNRSDLVILIASLCLVALIVWNTLCTCIAALILRSAYNRAEHSDPDQPLRLEVHARSLSGFSLKAFWLPLIEANWRWVAPPPVTVEIRSQRGRWREEVRPARRAVTDVIRRKLEARDVLGISSVRWEVDHPTRLVVLPPRGRLDSASLLLSLFSGDDVSDPLGEPIGDRVDMRPYAPGDPPRLILWKVYARTRKLMVRVHERAVTVQPRACAYLVAGAGDDPVAALARTVLENDLLGKGWRFGADNSLEPTSKLDEALLQLARSGNPPSGPSGLAGFLAQAAHDGYKSCLVFVPPGPGPWLDQVRAAAARSALRLTFVTAGAHAHKTRPSWRWLVLREPRKVATPGNLASMLEGREHRLLSYDDQSGTVRQELATRRAS